MRIISARLIVLAALLYSVSPGMAKESNFVPGKTGKSGKKAAAGCTRTTAQIDLNINNVRARLRSGGDMWWDGDDAKYEIPKIEPGSGTISLHSIFAGALWFGGIDAGGQLKVAAQTYRDIGDDFWTGPLDDNASIDASDCAFWDTHFKVTRAEVDSFLTTGNASDAIKNWPAKGNTIEIRGTSKFIDRDLAPYVDMNANGIYDPEGDADDVTGWHDYPKYDIKKEFNCKNEDMLFGDQTIYWIINDKGNIHSQSGAEPIGLEIQCQAFGFATSDEVNNMTFYDYTINNQSTVAISEFYMAQWVDTDVGNYDDDYVGCDVTRGLGFCYNGDSDDDGILGYGSPPPAVGFDFFRGPIADIGDGIDNDKDGTIDEDGEQIIMSNFTYFNRDRTVRGDPEKSTDFYGYMEGKWKDGTCITRGGNGYGGSECVNYMFPWTTDPDYPGDDWSEDTEGNPPADRRLVQSAGPFTLAPGALNKITIGVVWARASSGDQLTSVELMKAADDKAQALFDNCFQVLDGPDAPKLTAVELDKKLIINITNPTNSNNFGEKYQERDPIIDEINYSDTTYSFQGYKVYQTLDATVSTDELDNIERARLIYQCDLKDNVDKIVNYYYDSDIGADVATLEADGANTGIGHSIIVTTDAFATGDNVMINFKKYYFIAIAYAYNEYKEYDPTDALKLDGQKLPYMSGRKASGGGKISTITGIPHKPGVLNGGSIVQAEYGDGPEITQIYGYGNAGNHLELTKSTIESILTNVSVSQPVYQGSYGPVKITVADPVNVPCAEFKLYITGKTDGFGILMDSTARWMLVNETDNDTVFADSTMDYPNEQLIINHCVNINSDKQCSDKVNWGLMVSVNQVQEPGVAKDDENGVQSTSTIVFEQGSKPWFTGITDQDGINPFYNWIWAGNSTEANWQDIGCDNNNCLDPEGAFENIINGTWAPYRMCAYLESYDDNGDETFYYAPIYNDNTLSRRGVELEDLANVDLVITSDNTKWSNSYVVELSESSALAENNTSKMELRSVTKSQFPGYAIDLDRGRRLDIIFGEDSWWQGENGRDLEWNPTENVESDLSGSETSFLGGGKHWIYIMDSKYGSINSTTFGSLKDVYSQAMWVSMAHVETGYNLLETDVTVKLRVDNAYHTDNTNTTETFKYSFSTDSICATKQDAAAAKENLDLINIVPNPYYAFSGYETSQIDNRVKFTNLPDQCTISIYNFNGSLIEKINKESSDAFIDWDLKNAAGVPVSSGIYIIHINVPDVGDKLLKWFCVTRPIDLDTF